MNVDLAYTISGAKLFFPPAKGTSSGVFTAPTTSTLITGRSVETLLMLPVDLDLTANPAGTASGTVNAHLTPTVSVYASVIYVQNLSHHVGSIQHRCL